MKHVVVENTDDRNGGKMYFLIVVGFLNFCISYIDARNLDSSIKSEVHHELRMKGYVPEQVQSVDPEFYRAYSSLVESEIVQEPTEDGNYGNSDNSYGYRQKLFDELAKKLAPDPQIRVEYRRKVEDESTKQREILKNEILNTGNTSFREPSDTITTPGKSIYTITHRYRNGKVLIEYTTDGERIELQRKRLLGEWGLIHGLYVSFLKSYVDTYKGSSTSNDIKAINLQYMQRDCASYRTKKSEFNQIVGILLGNDSVISTYVNASDAVVHSTVKEFVANCTTGI